MYYRLASLMALEGMQIFEVGAGSEEGWLDVTKLFACCIISGVHVTYPEARSAHVVRLSS